MYKAKGKYVKTSVTTGRSFRVLWPQEGSYRLAFLSGLLVFAVCMKGQWILQRKCSSAASTRGDSSAPGRRSTCSSATSTGHVRLTVATNKSLSSRSPRPVRSWRWRSQAVEFFISRQLHWNEKANRKLEVYAFINTVKVARGRRHATEALVKTGMCKINESSCRLQPEARSFIIYGPIGGGGGGHLFLQPGPV